MPSTAIPEPPNHHAEYPAFSGIFGAVAGLTMLLGRGGLARLAADVGRVDSSDHVVDVGAGPGTAAREAARRGARVSGVDPASAMRGLARRFTPRDARIDWLEGAAEALPLPDGSATVLWSIATVHHWRDLEAGLSEVLRVLRPGGRLVAIERRRRPGARGLASHGWTPAQASTFSDRCVALGFADAEVQERRVGRTTHLVVTARRPEPS